MTQSRKERKHSNGFGRIAYLPPSPTRGMGASLMPGNIQRKALGRMSALIKESLEEELIALNAVAPDHIEQLPRIFELAVMDSLTNIVGEGEAIALSKLVGKSGLGEPITVYAQLDLLLGEGSGILKGAIQEEFRVKVHELYVRMIDQFVPVPEALAAFPIVS
ncbi:MAG: hypothetical protein OK438_00630 [Thaumarchaeota archaeon]|nr:hypothetical protein [Nitrososphaerota archaeon]